MNENTMVKNNNKMLFDVRLEDIDYQLEDRSKVIQVVVKPIEKLF